MNPIYRYIFLLVCIAFSSNLLAQWDDEWNNYADSRSVVGVDVDFFSASTAVTNAFVNQFYIRKGFIDNDLKNSVSKNLLSSNKVGGEFNTGIFYLHRPASKDIAWWISLKNRNHLDFKFTNDLFDGIFYGNKASAGRTMDFSDIKLASLGYNQIQLGLLKEKETSSIGLALSFLQSYSYRSITTGSTTLFTQEDGEYIDIKANDFQMQETDTLKKEVWDFNGYGTSLDIYFKKVSAKGNTFQLTIKDMGFLQFNSSSLTTSMDTTLHFEGISIDDILNLSDSILVGSQLNDSNYLEQFLPEGTFSSFSTPTPALVRISYKSILKEKKVEMTTALQYQFFANYTPQFILQGHFYLHPKVITTLSTSYGGYTKLALGAGIAIDFGKGFTLGLGSHYLPISTSQGGYFSLKQHI